MTILECMVSVLVLGIAMSIVVPVMQLADRQRLKSDRALICTQEASNILEQITSWNYADITQTKADELLKDTTKTRQFSNANWKVSIQPVTNGEVISIHIQLMNNNIKEPETELITWVYTK